MTDVLAIATAKRDELAQEVSRLKNHILDAQSSVLRLQQEVAEIDAWIATFHKLTGTSPPPTAAERLEIKPSPAPKNPDRTLIADIANEMIVAAGRPLSRKEIFDGLEFRGVRLRGKDPVMVLSTMLWRSKDQIVRLPGHGYWPADRDYPAASYFTFGGNDLLGMAANEPEDGVEADDAD